MYVVLVTVAGCSGEVFNEPLSRNANLDTLAVSDLQIAPVFSSDITEYSVTVPSNTETVTVNARKAGERSAITVRLNGAAWQEIMSERDSPLLAIVEGHNLIEVHVMAENQDVTKVYTIDLYRMSASAMLENLATSEGFLTPVFSSETVIYSLTVDNGTSSLSVTPTPLHAAATIDIRVNETDWTAATAGMAGDPMALNVGDNLIKVRVTAEDGTTGNIYEVQVHRISSSAELTGLSISAGTLDPVFTTATADYAASIGSTVSLLKVTPTPADETTTIEVCANGGNWLIVPPGVPSSSLWMNVGDNTVDLRIRAEDGITETGYSLLIRRLRGIADLSSLVISAGTTDEPFDAADYLYTMTVANTVTSTTITPTAADGLATVQYQINDTGYHGVVSGETTPILDLNPGYNTVEVLVTAEDPEVSRAYDLILSRRYPGAMDVGFWPGDSAIDTYAMAVQSDHSVLAAYPSQQKLRRYTPTGEVDPVFIQPDASVSVIVPQDDGKIIVGGNFITYLDTPRANIARLNADGSVDNSFPASGTGTDYSVYAATLQGDGKILIGGGFSTYNGVARSRLARLNGDGTLDETFLASGAGVQRLDSTTRGATVQTINVMPDGKILVGGSFDHFNDVPAGNLVLLNTDGSVDETFQSVGTGAPGVAVGASGVLGMAWDSAVDTIALQDDGKIIIAGSFTTYNGAPRNGIARLNADGTVDETFLPSGTTTGFNSSVRTVAIQTDGKILVGGGFSTYNEESVSSLLRLNSDSTVDTTFLSYGTGPLGTVYECVVQDDGMIVIGGTFWRYNDIEPGQLIRLWPD